MITVIHLSICDRCDTVSSAPEYTPCQNCGYLMLASKFVRASNELFAAISPDADLRGTGLTKEEVKKRKDKL